MMHPPVAVTKTDPSKLVDALRTQADAYAFLEDLRWGDKPACPHCGSARKSYFLNPQNGASRKTTHGSATERRVWKCSDCRKQFSVLTNTIFHGTHIPVRTWMLVVFEMCSSKNGVAARELERQYGFTAKTASLMLHHIRQAMKRDPTAGLLSGRAVAVSKSPDTPSHTTGDKLAIPLDPKTETSPTRQDDQQSRTVKPPAIVQLC